MEISSALAERMKRVEGDEGCVCVCVCVWGGGGGGGRFRHKALCTWWLLWLKQHGRHRMGHFFLPSHE